MKVISFGDSFTQGLGVDRIKEQKFFDDNPNDKTKARKLHRAFTHSLSFTKLFADKLGVEWENLGESGCNNRRILSNAFDSFAQGRYKKGDLAIVTFTSTLRDKLPFTPELYDKQWAGVTWSINELVDLFRDYGSLDDYKKHAESNLLQGLEVTDKNITFSYFYREWIKFFVTDMFEFRYLDFFNLNAILMLQKFFEFIEVDYIFVDAFELSFNNSTYNKTEFINKDKYWRFGEHTIYSYLGTFENRDLYELDGYNIPSEHIPLHPSAEGHKLFTEDLYEFYIKNKKSDEKKVLF